VYVKVTEPEELEAPTVTVTGTVPSNSNGVCATQTLLDLHSTLLEASAPKVTVVAPGVVLNPVPWILTDVAANSGPDVGDTDVTVTAAAADALATAITLNTAAKAAIKATRIDRLRTTIPPIDETFLVGRGVPAPSRVAIPNPTLLVYGSDSQHNRL
jgi:hypothetical protein